MTRLPDQAAAALEEILGRTDPGILGVVLSGSAGREGMATERSDVDVFVVYRDAVPHGMEKRPFVDEVTVSIADLEQTPPAFGSDTWWVRWSFAWVPVLRDEDGRIARAVQRIATLSPDEQPTIVRDRLDGVVNIVFRALKSDRDGRRFESRLDVVEAISWLLDTIFALSARIRPYNKYLAWELREHPLDVPEWSAAILLPQIEAMLEGDAAALRAVYGVVERECLRFDEVRGETACREIIDDWGDQILLLRPQAPE